MRTPGRGRVPLHCIVPPFVLERMCASPDARVRRFALANLASSAEVRAARIALGALGGPRGRALAPPRPRKHRLVYDLSGQPPYPFLLPGKLVRGEGDAPSGDPAVDEAYRHSGTVHDFYRKELGRNSLDDRGMALVSSVHVGRRFNNAFWNGAQMAYGDGDGVVFQRFTRALEVVGHELTHGVVAFTSDLAYQDEPGALNEHMADVFGVLVRQWGRGEAAREADWLVGAALLRRAPTRRALRSLRAPGTAFRDDPHLGSDPQPAHYRDRYRGSEDHGGVHINSGIPNHAFYRAATAIGGAAWKRAGAVWYAALLELRQTSAFADLAKLTARIAGERFGRASAERRAVRAAWKAVGVPV
jgi:Zn-dependent metalloprotease